MSIKKLTQAKNIAFLGECMIELSGPKEAIQLGFGGDTLNAATYFARAYSKSAPAFVTALGDDPYSDQMIASWMSEGINCDLVERVKGRLPGLYLIETDKKGERSFFYWRNDSPARNLLDDEQQRKALFNNLLKFDLIYLSGVTLSIFHEAALAHLRDFFNTFRKQGGLIAFDSNYRQKRWQDHNNHLEIFRSFYQCCDIALPTFEDEAKLFGVDSVHALQEQLNNFGVKEFVIKEGHLGCWIGADTLSRVPVPEPVTPIDTTGAGDSFNGTYLAARMLNYTPKNAALAGHRCAAEVIKQAGAIIAQ